MKCGRAHSQRAFTLVEIMMVIGIIALVMAIGLPAFVKAGRKTSMQQAVTDFTDACVAAREQAIMTGSPVELVFHSDGLTITVQKAPPPAPDPEPTSVVATPNSAFAPVQAPPPPPVAEPAGSPAISKALPSDVGVQLIAVNFQDYMEADEAHVRFFPNGTCDEFTVILAAADGASQMITLDVVTAIAQVKELSGSRNNSDYTQPRKLVSTH